MNGAGFGKDLGFIVWGVSGLVLPEDNKMLMALTEGGRTWNS